jgi:hypothetical protein
VVDDDLGWSAAGTVPRAGFEGMVAEVYLGHGASRSRRTERAPDRRGGSRGAHTKLGQTAKLAQRRPGVPPVAPANASPGGAVGATRPRCRRSFARRISIRGGAMAGWAPAGFDGG